MPIKSPVGTQKNQQGQFAFNVWAPFQKKLSVKIVADNKKQIPLKRDDWGYWNGVGEGLTSGTKYLCQLDDGRTFPDPASFYQPQGVHGPSEIIDHDYYIWDDATWRNIPLSEQILYEMHIGTFTAEGSFAAAAARIDDLIDLGINAVEIMPVAQFPGERNWGYDGVYPFAVQNSYGGPRGLKDFINRCHQKGLAVILDVVYNHLGPEGNYLGQYGPYFTEKYKTPWGQAVNFDDAYCYGVRNYFIQNALYWFKEYHLDALRLDAIHGIYDSGARHILQEMAEEVAELAKAAGRSYYLIAESDLNDVRVIKPETQGGYGIDAQWCDDFHHVIHTLLTGEDKGYYADFGQVNQLVKTLNEHFIYSWDYSAFRKCQHGSEANEMSADKFVTFIQNHDQIGNRMKGERLSVLVDFEKLKCAAGLLFLSPGIPMLFMGEEYAEKAPFLYFTHHSDENLIKSVQHGRRNEFKAFGWQEDPSDPQSEFTFDKSKLNGNLKDNDRHQCIYKLYQILIALRKNCPPLQVFERSNIKAVMIGREKAVILRRWKGNHHFFIIFNLGETEITMALPDDLAQANKILDSSEEMWSGEGSSSPLSVSSGQEITVQKRSFLIYEQKDES
ncbi:MAG: malto-oligosyltrehalose trehalohydrolase [Candidatus Omnitrophica bacterium]|nr:malto-oligosyltrehalose trehalohydrolase [Candidatus Omnitrophota bacterium]